MDATRDPEKATVLVVDDTPENIDVLTGLLKDDYRVRAAVDGPTALTLVRKFPPDIILLDIMMPRMDGYEVFQALKDDPLACRIPVIFVTAMNESEDEKKGLDLGAVDYIVKPFSPALVKARVRNHLALQDRRRTLEQQVQARTHELATANETLAREVNLRNQALERAEYLFNFDALTGLPNRHQFADRLSRQLERARQDGQRLALIGISLDRFNVVKISLGGTVSDQLLLQTSMRLQHNLASGDLLARTGGEEFSTVVVTAPSNDGDDALQDAAESISLRLRSALSVPFELSSGSAEVRASVAYALFPEDGDTADLLMRHMESALEHVKLTGGDNVERFDRNVDLAVGAAFTMESRIREALKERAFQAWYQPKIEIASGRVVGAEVLARWPLASGEMISPAKFIPVAERSGLIGEIDQFMLEEACHQIARWSAQSKDFRIGVNVSATAFQSPGLVENVRATLSRCGAQAKHLELEITEYALITDLNVAIAKLGALREMGVCIALDDFGTGYSSMGYLLRLPIDVLKVDQTFVRGIEDDKNAAAIVRALITMAEALNLKIVAEGVETRGQLDFVREHARNASIQGWIYSPAVQAAEMTEILARGVMQPVVPRAD